MFLNFVHLFATRQLQTSLVVPNNLLKILILWVSTYIIVSSVHNTNSFPFLKLRFLMLFPF